MPATLKEDCRENFNGKLESKLVKIKGCHISRAPVPERLPVCLENLCKVSRNTAVQNDIRAFRNC